VKRIGILLSGRGSNFEAIADSVAAGRIEATEAKFAEMCGVRIHSSAKSEYSPI